MSNRPSDIHLIENVLLECSKKKKINIKHDDFRKLMKDKQRIIKLTPEMFSNNEILTKRKFVNFSIIKIKKSVWDSPPVTPESEISTPSTTPISYGSDCSNELDSRSSTLSDNSSMPYDSPVSEIDDYSEFGLISKDHIEMIDMLNNFTNEGFWNF